MSNIVNINLRTLSGEVLQMAVNADDSVKTVVQKLLIAEPKLFKCSNFVRIVRNENDKNDHNWEENETAVVFYDFEPKSYHIHDNGGVPFIVEITDEMIYIYASYPSDEADEDGYIADLVDDYLPVKGELITEMLYEKVWIGDNELNDCDGYTEKDIYPGNSILVHLSGDKYLYIGSEIYKFDVVEDDYIKMYFSPVGRSDVPYPYAIGEKMVYFMLDQNVVPVDMIDVNKDGYHQFYEQFFETDRQDELVSFKIEMVCERTF